MPSISTTIKTNIKAVLDALKTAGTLGYVIEDDFKTDPLSRNIPAFPCAILTSPALTSERDTNRDNLRTYTFEIVIVHKGENITSTTEIETLMDAILNAFDSDPTLAGAAVGEVNPAASSPEMVMAGDKTYLVFVVTIAARAIYRLGS